MRFLHTADWHLGRQIRNQSRLDEFVAVVDEVVDIALAEQVDFVLVAGDIFDTFSPHADSERVLYEALARLCSGGTRAVLLAGNHDHAPRMDALAGVLEIAGIHSVGSPPVPDSPANAWVRVTSRDGSEEAAIVALPWIPERRVMEYERLHQGGAEAMKHYADRMADAIKWFCTDAFKPSSINVFTWHLMIDGAAIAEGSSERKLHTGHAFAVDPACLPVDAQYVALGHVHRPQHIGTAGQRYYAGSLLQLDFGEAGQRKSVNLVEARPRQGAQVRQVELTKGRSLQNMTLRLEDLERTAGTAGDDYLRVVVELDEYVPELFTRVRAILPNALDVSYILPESGAGETPPQRSGLSPEELFSRFYEQKRKGPPSEKLLAAFTSLYDAEVHGAPAEA
jgi:exonuclease SbcD